MYLTRFRFNTARRGARSLLASPRRIRAAVKHGFPEPDRLVTDDERLLWRVDQASRHDALLYVVSIEEPDFTHLVEEAGWPTRKDGWVTRPYDGLLSRLAEGQRWAFRLTANPAVYTWAPSTQTRTRTNRQWLGHVTVEQQVQWLLDRNGRWGFEVEKGDGGAFNLSVSDRSTVEFKRHEEKTKVTLRVATFDGVLTVIDPDSLRLALTKGIGRSKAYGCGLMTLAPVG